MWCLGGTLCNSTSRWLWHKLLDTVKWALKWMWCGWAWDMTDHHIHSNTYQHSFASSLTTHVVGEHPTQLDLFSDESKVRRPQYCSARWLAPSCPSHTLFLNALFLQILMPALFCWMRNWRLAVAMSSQKMCGATPSSVRRCLAATWPMR